MTDPDISIDIRIESGNWPDDVAVIAQKAARAAFARSDAEIKGPLEIAVLLTGDVEQQAINRNWRAIDKPTNVLSFPSSEPFTPLDGPVGDLSLAFETFVREAEAQGVSFSDHFTHLFVHGCLHLIGYDHQTEAEALVMEGLETEILAELGIADPYAD